MADRGDLRWEDDSQPTKDCIICGETLSLLAFYKSKKNLDGHENCCKACRNVRSKLHYASNKEAYRDRTKFWREQNPERALEFNRRWRNLNQDIARIANDRWRAKVFGSVGEYTVDEWLALLEQYDGKCVKCGSQERVGRDHVVPLSRGGFNCIDNIQPLCLRCNQQKGTDSADYRK